jgi:hypothetical protein
VPYAITELQLLSVLEKYYGITGQLRFRSLTDRFYPVSAPEGIAAQIESSSFKTRTAGMDKTGQGKMSPESKTQSTTKGKGLEPVEASITNAVNAAKQFYKDQGISLNDSSIEDELIVNWDRLSEKLKERRN